MIILPMFICMFKQESNFDCFFLSISYLQYAAYPLSAPRNESFPDTYISTRHNFFSFIFNETMLNPLIHLNNPLVGTWFAMVKIETLEFLINIVYLGIC
jgi:hypothetical protein